MQSYDLSKKLPLHKEDADNRHKLVINSANDTVYYDLTVAFRSRNDKSLQDEKFDFDGIAYIKFNFYQNEKE